MEECECKNWCRSDIGAPYHVRSNDGIPIPTDHHPNCDRYNDSLIDVWVASRGGDNCFSTDEAELLDYVGETDGVEVKRIKMHREVYENLPEFKGF